MNTPPSPNGRWKDAFAFTRRERRGILLLLCILAAESAALTVLHFLPESLPPAESGRFTREADSLFATLTRAPAATVRRVPAETARRISPFDPNALDSTGWRRTGLPERVIRTLDRYRSAGGRFRTKSDLRRIHGMDDTLYRRVEPYLLLPDALPPRVVPAVARPKPEPLDIGTADSAALVRLRGVGPVFARRICAYRERLGGFTGIRQLAEVYGMDDSLLATILPQVILRDTAVRGIPVNTGSFETLSRHPYVGRALATVMVNYRRQHGGFRSAEEVLRIPLVTEELSRKLAPYLRLE